MSKLSYKGALRALFAGALFFCSRVSFAQQPAVSDGSPATQQVPIEASASATTTPEPKQPIRMISGSDGIPFPSPEHVVLEPSPTPEVQPTKTPEPTPTPYQRAKRCERAGTSKQVVRPDKNDNQILADKLFVGEDLIPLDPDEVYGTGVKLYPYGPGVGEGQYILQEMYKVPCLPFRIRITEWGQYEHSGEDALKKYDERGKRGVPTLHPWVSEKLYGAKTSKKRGR